MFLLDSFLLDYFISMLTVEFSITEEPFFFPGTTVVYEVDVKKCLSC
jgi:hypothetical protein